MGLAICHWIVEAHGGEIAAEPNDLGGTTFRCMLPVERFAPHAIDIAPVRSAPPEIAETPGDATVCIVDDDEASRAGVARLLSAEGWPTIAFASATDALASPILATAQCLVLDVQMPGMDGADLQAEMARLGIATPIVFLSARSDAPTGVEAMKRGAFEYLAKPVDANHAAQQPPAAGSDALLAAAGREDARNLRLLLPVFHQARADRKSARTQLH